MKKPTRAGKCPACGDEDLVLAEERLKYTDVRKLNGVLQRVHGTVREEALDSDESVRLFCSACGEYMSVPKELQ